MLCLQINVLRQVLLSELLGLQMDKVKVDDNTKLMTIWDTGLNRPDYNNENSCEGYLW